MIAMNIEHDGLPELEARIEHGLETFLDVGAALMAIRDRRLYRESGHTTFEHYCNKRWSLKERRAYQLIDAARVALAIVSEAPVLVEPSSDDAADGSCTIVQLPTNEAQTRELARLKEPYAIRAVWHETVAGKGPDITAKDIRAAVDQRLGMVSVPVISAHDRAQPRVGDIAQLPPMPLPTREERAWNRLADMAPITELDPIAVARACTNPMQARMYLDLWPRYAAWVATLHAELERLTVSGLRLIDAS